MFDAKLGLQLCAGQLAELATNTNVLPHLGKQKENKRDGDDIHLIAVHVEAKGVEPAADGVSVPVLQPEVWGEGCRSPLAPQPVPATAQTQLAAPLLLVVLLLPGTEAVARVVTPDLAEDLPEAGGLGGNGGLLARQLWQLTPLLAAVSLSQSEQSMWNGNPLKLFDTNGLIS